MTPPGTEIQVEHGIRYGAGGAGGGRDVAGRARPRPVHLTHGTKDTIVDAGRSTDLFTALRRRGWPVSLTTQDIDHAGIVMTQYDPRTRRCRPTRVERAVAAGTATARVLAQAAGRTLDDDAPGPFERF